MPTGSTDEWKKDKLQLEAADRWDAMTDSQKERIRKNDMAFTNPDQ